MLPVELTKQIRLLEIRTRRAVDEIIGGAYRSVFKGRGIEFEEVREYTQDDDVRDIDWNVTARMGSPYIKKYVEERELTVLFLVDVSASGAFGSSEKSKRRTAAELAALLTFSAGKNGDKVGLMMFSDKIELYVPPRSGSRHTLRLIREMLAFEPASTGTDIDLALKECAKLMKKRGIVFLLSDLIAGESFETSLKLLNRRHDVVALQISDPVEQSWPTLRPVVVEDAESGALLSLPGGGNQQKKMDMYLAESRRLRQELCRRAQVDLVELQTGSDVLRPVIEFFAGRRQRINSRG
ncbi:MAG: DUF58 domain-containing protein [Lentisphaeria bacterium]|nr:DUF58 domain-containing protein [Lentisphaeria bacterium]